MSFCYNGIMTLTAKTDKNDHPITRETILELEDIIEKKSLVIQHHEARIRVLEEFLRLEKHKRFGSSSEQYPGQGELFNEAESILEGAEQDAIEPKRLDEPLEETTPKKKPGRKGFSDLLPREQVFIDLSDEEKEGALDTFYSKVKEELDIVPAKVRIIEYMQEKAVFVENGQRKIVTAALPKHPIGKVMASIGLLAYLIIAKYMDGLPLYRLEGILKRYGGDVTRTSMASWIIALAEQCQPLIHVMREHQHSGSLVQMDETRIQVLKEPGYVTTGNKYMWVTLGGPPNEPVVIFDYDPSRGHEVPLRLLDGYQGYLQSDGYAGYDAASDELKLVQVGCWDHCRRKFKDAQSAQPKGMKNTHTKADIALAKIGKLYRIERKIKKLTAKQKYEVRQKKSLPILRDLKDWMDKNMGKSPKDSLISTALIYMNNQWPKLIRYCEDGNIPISNILAENAIRPFVIGRKAWLFSDTPKGARASGIFYSLIETAKANGVEPYAYLRHIFKALPYADSVEKIEALLPWNVKGDVTALRGK